MAPMAVRILRCWAARLPDTAMSTSQCEANVNNIHFYKQEFGENHIKTETWRGAL